MPTIQGGPDAFDHGFDVPADYDNTFGTFDALTSPLYQNRLNTLHALTNGTNQGVRKNISGSPQRAWAAFPFRYTPQPSGSTVQVFNFGTNSGVTGGLGVGSTGFFTFTSAGGVGAPEFAASANTWYWIELIYSVSGTAHTTHARINGSDGPTANGTSTDTFVTFNQVLSTAGNPTGFDLYWGGYWVWGTAASTTDWLGEPSAAPPGRRRIIGPRHLPASAETLYTVPSGRRCTLQNIWASNPSGSPVDISLSIGTDAAATRIFDDHPVLGDNVLYRRRGADYVLEAGEVIQGFADTASTVVLMVDAYEEQID